MEISIAAPEELRPLRSRVLRPGLPFETTFFEGDDRPTTLHLAGRIGGEVVCIATFVSQVHPELPAVMPYRLRGMATAEHFQGRGLGRQILEYGMQLLRERECDLLWANAREEAFPFYEKMNFYFHGEMFDIPTVGPHKVIYKHLISP